jgi:hypothetical protein
MQSATFLIVLRIPSVKGKATLTDLRLKTKLKKGKRDLMRIDFISGRKKNRSVELNTTDHELKPELTAHREAEQRYRSPSSTISERWSKRKGYNISSEAVEALGWQSQLN